MVFLTQHIPFHLEIFPKRNIYREELPEYFSSGKSNAHAIQQFKSAHKR